MFKEHCNHDRAFIINIPSILYTIYGIKYIMLYCIIFKIQMCPVNHCLSKITWPEAT